VQNNEKNDKTCQPGSTAPQKKAEPWKALPRMIFCGLKQLLRFFLPSSRYTG